MRLRHRAAVVGCATVLLAAMTQTGANAATTTKIADGCTADKPTALTGAIFGYPDNYSLGALVAMDLLDDKGNKITPDGKTPTGGYSYTDWVNSASLDADGSPKLAYERDWGKDASSGQLCVTAKVKTAFFEVYPKSRITDPYGNIVPNAQRNSIHYTDTVRYGLATLQNQKVIVGARNSWTLRLPLNSASFDQHGHPGSTGDIKGVITYNGHIFDPGPDHKYLRVNTWANSSTGCGVHGFATNVDASDYDDTGDAITFVQHYLAGGQCGAKTQLYKVVVDCYYVCGTTQVTMRQQVAVTSGTTTIMSFAFEG